MLAEILARIDWAATGAMIGGLSTAVVAILTLVLVRENRLLRRAGNSPVVVAHFEPHPEGNGVVKLAFSNVGTGPALDVTYSFEQQHFENYRLIFRHEKERPPLDLPPDIRASLILVESVSQEDGHEEAIHRRTDHQAS